MEKAWRYEFSPFDPKFSRRYSPYGKAKKKRRRKEMKDIQIGKTELKTLFKDNMIYTYIHIYIYIYIYI